MESALSVCGPIKISRWLVAVARVVSRCGGGGQPSAVARASSSGVRCGQQRWRGAVVEGGRRQLHAMVVQSRWDGRPWVRQQWERRAGGRPLGVTTAKDAANWVLETRGYGRVNMQPFNGHVRLHGANFVLKKKKIKFWHRYQICRKWIWYRNIWWEIGCKLQKTMRPKSQ